MNPAFLAVSAFVCLAAAPALSASGSAAYLKDGPGARWLGMGGAARAAAGGVGAVFWNPAGLTAQGPTRWMAGSMLALAPYSRSTVMLSACWLTDSAGAFGLGWLRSSVDELERVDSAGNVTGVSSDTEDAIELSFGTAILYQLRAGVALKYLRQDLFDHTATGAAANLGILVQPLLAYDLLVGVTAENVISSFSWDTGRRDRPAAGIGLGTAWCAPGRNLLAAADVVLREGEDQPSYHAGIEARPVEAARVRAGVDNGWPAAGLSYFWRLYQFHYAFTWNRAGLGNVHQTSLVVSFE